MSCQKLLPKNDMPSELMNLKTRKKKKQVMMTNIKSLKNAE